jgi:hypothetical protein
MQLKNAFNLKLGMHYLLSLSKGQNSRSVFYFFSKHEKSPVLLRGAFKLASTQYLKMMLILDAAKNNCTKRLL